MSGLCDADELPLYLIMGAICNPLMQCSERMIEAGLCTQQQYDHGKEELLQMMTSYYETREETVEEVVVIATGRTNKWDKKKRGATPADKAMKDFEVYENM